MAPPRSDADHKKTLTPAEVARAYGVHVKTVRAWVRKGIITHLRVGPHHLTRIPRAEAERHFRVARGV